jgi:hypothetical protein
MKELQINEKGKPFFVHQGIEIVNPTMDGDAEAYQI